MQARRCQVHLSGPKVVPNGPSMHLSGIYVMCFKGCIINEFRFHTKERDNKRKTQNSGVIVIVGKSSFVSAQNMNPITGDVPYDGVLTEVVELHCLRGNKVVLFKCDWWNVINVGR